MAAADLHERFSGALHNTARAWRQAVDRRLKLLGVSQAGWMTIVVVAKAPEPLSQSEIAERLGVEGPTMVAMVDRLVNAKLITREPSIKDRRIKHVVLTEAGHRMYDSVKTEADAVRRELLANIDSKELEIATAVLEALQSKIDSVS
jgi:MarR family transcriptional regulator, transcriptional regulator for hemolysin